MSDYPKVWAERFREAAEKAEQRGPRKGVEPKIHAAMIAGYRSQADSLDPPEPSPPCE